MTALAALQWPARLKRSDVRLAARSVITPGWRGYDVLVIATGASRSLLTLAPEFSALTPIKGHILRAPALKLDGPVVRMKGGYICPSPLGAMIGATMETGRDDRDIDPASVARLRGLGATIAPAIVQAEITTSTGVRATTTDGLPLVGAGRTPGVWLAAGARRNGWLLAPLIAEEIVRGPDGEKRSSRVIRAWAFSHIVRPCFGERDVLRAGVRPVFDFQRFGNQSERLVPRHQRGIGGDCMRGDHHVQRGQCDTLSPRTTLSDRHRSARRPDPKAGHRRGEETA